MTKITMKKFNLWIAVLLIAVFVSGCTNYVRSDVTRFHAPSNFSAAKKFVFLPDEAQYKSLEYKRYSELIAGQLAQHGFNLVGTKSQANYGVKFSYGTDNGRTVIESDPFYGSVGVGTGHHRGVNVGVSTVFGSRGYGGYGGSISSDTVYSRQLHVDIVNLGNDSPAFEGTAISRGRSASFAPVSACLIQALFSQFPGQNGDTERVKIDTKACLN